MKRKGKRSRVSKKISHIMHEPDHPPQRQAVAMAMNMEREGRITPSGGYRRAGKKKSRRKSGRS